MAATTRRPLFWLPAHPVLAGMEVTRDKLKSLIAEALPREGAFRPRRRNWSETT